MNNPRAKAPSDSAAYELERRLIGAIHDNNLQTAQQAIAEGATGRLEILPGFHRGYTALMAAAHLGHPQMVELLLPISNPHDQSYMGARALDDAVAGGSAEIAARLAGVTRDSDALERAFLLGVKLGRKDVALALLPWVGQKTKARGMREALLRREPALAAALAPLVPELHGLKLTMNGRSLLMIAATLGDASLISALLPGSDPFLVDKQGRSASDHAKLSGFPSLAGQIDARALSIVERAALMEEAHGAPVATFHGRNRI